MEPVQPPNPHGTPFLRVLALLAFALLIAVLSSVGTYWYLSKQLAPQQTQQQVYQLAPTVAPSISVSPTISQDETANWKEFNKSGITFKYPSSWETQTVTDDPTNLFYIIDRSFKTKSPQAFNYQISVSEIKNPNNLSFADFFQKQYGYPASDATQITVNGYTAYKTEKAPSLGGALNIFISNNKDAFIVFELVPYSSTNSYDKQQKYFETFNQILSTFKVTQ